MKKFTTLFLSGLAVAPFAQDNAPALSGSDSKVPAGGQSAEAMQEFLRQWAMFNWFVWIMIIAFSFLIGYFIGFAIYLARIKSGKAKGATGCGCFIALLGFILGFILISWAVVSFGPPWVYAETKQKSATSQSSDSSAMGDGQSSPSNDSSAGATSEEKY